MFRRLAPYVAVLSALGFFACFAYLAHISPPRPNPATGQVAQMNDHGYLFYVHPWQGWVLNMGPLVCIGVILVISGMARRRVGTSTAITAARWMQWVYFAGLAAFLLYLFFGQT